jgi:hypothetical protein
MIKKILKAIHDKYPYHYQLAENYLKTVFLLGESMQMEAMDFVEEMGFKLELCTILSKAVTGPKQWTQMEYFYRYNMKELPVKEQKFLIEFMGANDVLKRKLIKTQTTV